jgi:hypothetical protein
MTVEQLFTEERISLSDLDDRSDESKYWESCYSFVKDVWKEDISELTTRQATWVDKIQEDMIEWRIENK